MYGSKINNIYNQSTTGNITGIYDMSGGTWEYVMGNDNKNTGSSGITALYSDFFTNDKKWGKYYDLYVNGTSSETAYNKRILGDATGEMGPFANVSIWISSWYSDGACFIRLSYPWFYRGGDCTNSSNGGIFRFHDHNGSNGNISFRIVLTPTK